MSEKLPLISPGEILHEEFMQPYGISMNKLAQDLHVPTNRISDIIRGRRAITPDTAMRLSRYFGNTVQFWLNLQLFYDLKAAQRALHKQITNEVIPFRVQQEKRAAASGI